MGSYTHLQTAKQLETLIVYATHKTAMEYDQLLSYCRICQNLLCENYLIWYATAIL